MRINKLIFGVGIVLILLILFTVLLGGFFQKKEDDATIKATPVPTGFTGSGGRLLQSFTQEELRREQEGLRSVNEIEERMRLIESLSTEDKDLLRLFNEKLPFQSDDLDIEYSPDLNQYFISRKTPNANNQLNQFLTSNNFLSFFRRNQRLFSSSNKSTQQQLEDAGNSLVDAITDHIESEEDTAGTSGNAAPNEEVKPLIEAISNILRFDPTTAEVSPTPPAPSSSAQDLLNNPNLKLAPLARRELQSGIVDQKLVRFIGRIVQERSILITYFKDGRTCTRTPRGCVGRSNHADGRAADIFMVNNESVSPRSTQTRAFVQWMINIPRNERPNEIGQPFKEYEPVPGVFENLLHHNHVHIGYDR